MFIHPIYIYVERHQGYDKLLIPFYRRLRISFVCFVFVALGPLGSGIRTQCVVLPQNKNVTVF